MKKLLFLLIVFYCITASAQDTLVLLDETAIGVRILKDTENEYFYYLWNDQNKYQRAINKKFIKNVKLQNKIPSIPATDTRKADRSDLIVYRNGDEMKVEVVDVGKENIIYREEGKEVNYVIPIAEVERIEYSDGQRLDFNSALISQQPKLINSSNKSSVSDPVTEPEAIGGDIDKNRLVGFAFGGKVGYFAPVNDVIMETFGTGFTYGFYIGYWGRNGFGWNLEARDYSKKGKVTSDGDYTSTNIDLLFLTTSINYAFVEKGKFKTYAGIGVGATFFSLKDQSSTYNKTLFEYYPFGGIYYKPFQLEFRFVNAMHEKSNVGGVEICFGLIF